MKPITADMLIGAAAINDLDEALRSVMDVVGIDDGGVAGLVFSGDRDRDWWPTAAHTERMEMLRRWAAAEEAMGGEPDLPPDPDKQNDDRAEWAGEAIKAFARATNMDAAGEDDETILGDLLDGLQHWCDRRGIDFDAALEQGRQYYIEETQP
jgi:hypothetical protein